MQIGFPSTSLAVPGALGPFPAASLIADNRALPSTTDVAAWLYGYDGALGDLVRIVGPTANPGATERLIGVSPQLVGSGDVWRRQLDAGAFTDASAGAGVAAVVEAQFNETTYERVRGNTEGTLLASAARTVTTQSADFTAYDARGIMVFLRVTASTGAGGLQVQIWGKDPASGTYFELNTLPTAITTNISRAYVLYPGDTTASGQVAQSTSRPVPRTFCAVVTVGNADSYTYSLGYALIR